MLETTISQLKEMNLISGEDLVIACTDQPSIMSAVLFGALGAAIASAKSKAHILSANANAITIFDIDKKTGAYSGNFGHIPRDVIKKVTASGLGAKRILIKTDDITYKFQAQPKFRGFMQKEALAAMIELFNTQYTNN